MGNCNFKQTICDANASGREHSFAPQNIYCNALFNSKEVQNVEGGQNGRSMIEMLGVLAIIGVLSVGGIAGYSKAMQKYRINKTIEQITLIAGNVRTFWGPQKNYLGVQCSSNDTDGSCGKSGCSGFDRHVINGSGDYIYLNNNGCPIVKKARIFPDEMITVTDGKIMSITNPFGGGVELWSASKSKSGDNQAFGIGYKLPDDYEVCIEMLSHDWTAAGVKGIVSKILGPGTVLAVQSSPFSLDDAISACTTIINTESKFKYFLFYFDVNSNCWNETNGNRCS